MKDLEWRGRVNERFTGVEKADLAGRGRDTEFESTRRAPGTCQRLLLRRRGMVKGMEWRDGVNERCTDVDNKVLAGRGEYRARSEKNEPWHKPRARFATERDGEGNRMAWRGEREVYGCGKGGQDG